MSAWPSIAFTARRSAPRSSRWVAKLWRSVCGWTLRRPAAAAWRQSSFQKPCRVMRRPRGVTNRSRLSRAPVRCPAAGPPPRAAARPARTRAARWRRAARAWRGRERPRPWPRRAARAAGPPPRRRGSPAAAASRGRPRPLRSDRGAKALPRWRTGAAPARRPGAALARRARGPAAAARRRAAAPGSASPAPAPARCAPPANRGTRAGPARTTRAWPAAARARRAGAKGSGRARRRAAPAHSRSSRSSQHPLDASLPAPQHHGPRTGQVDHRGRLVQRHPAVEDEVQPMAELVLDVRRVGERLSLRDRRAGGGQGTPQAMHQRRGDGRVRDPHADRALPRQRGARHQPGRRQHHGVRSREEPPQQAEPVVVDDRVLRHLTEIAAEKRERLARVAPLEQRHPLDGLLLEQVAADRVVGVGRVAHQAARLEHRHRARDVPRLRVHGVDRLDGSATRHRAMLRARRERRKKSGVPAKRKRRPRDPGPPRSFSRGIRQEELLLVLATGVDARATARRFSLPLGVLGRGGAAGRRSSQPLALLDQLADLLATLVADLRVELRAAARAHALSTLLPDLLVELVPALRLDGLAALLADLLVEGPAALLRDLHASLATCLGNRHPALLLVRHLLPPVVGRIPPPLRRQPPRPRSVSCPARSAP